MGELMLEILLSNFMVFIVMGIALLLVTTWAFRLREFAGYGLGWLVGIFLIIFMSLFTTNVDSGTMDASTLSDERATLTVNFFGAMIASAFGLAIGFGILELVKFGGRSESRAARALLIATLTTIILVCWYLLLMASQSTRLVIALFVLAFFIGMLFNYIVSRRYPTGYTAQYPPVDYPTTPMDAQSAPYGNLDSPQSVEVPMDIPSPIAQRLENMRNIAQRRRQ
jgi:hypothetical protein